MANHSKSSRTQRQCVTTGLAGRNASVIKHALDAFLRWYVSSWPSRQCELVNSAGFHSSKSDLAHASGAVDDRSTAIMASLDDDWSVPVSWKMSDVEFLRWRTVDTRICGVNTRQYNVRSA